MTEKKPPETDPEQSERFRKAVRDLEAAGELNHTVDDRFGELLTHMVPEKRKTAREKKRGPARSPVDKSD